MLLNEEDTFRRYIASQAFVRYVRRGPHRSAATGSTRLSLRPLEWEGSGRSAPALDHSHPTVSFHAGVLTLALFLPSDLLCVRVALAPGARPSHHVLLSPYPPTGVSTTISATPASRSRRSASASSGSSRRPMAPRRPAGRATTGAAAARSGSRWRMSGPRRRRSSTRCGRSGRPSALAGTVGSVLGMVGAWHRAGAGGARAAEQRVRRGRRVIAAGLGAVDGGGRRLTAVSLTRLP